MTSEPLIRPARADDLPGVSALLAETWHATYDDLYGRERVGELTGRWHAVDALAEELDRTDRRLLVAESGGRLVGTASIRRSGDGAMLDRLYVHPDAQGRGVGADLLGASLASFPDSACVVLEVDPANTGAIRFYERHGFRIEGHTSDCAGTGDGIPALTMVRTTG